MIDPFEVAEAPLGEPLSIVIGQSVQWRREIAIDNVLFSLTYDLRPSIGGSLVSPQALDMTGVSSGVFAVDAVPGDTSGWIAGRYAWDLIVTRTSDSRKKTIETGEMHVFDNVVDRRSHAEVMVTKIESLLSNRADNDVESYTIKSRSITKMSVVELRSWRDYYIREISNQSVDAGVFKKPGPSKSTLRVRFVD